MTLDLAGCPDAELAALALAGRESAYGELMRRHREAVYRLVRGLTGDAEASLDLTQQSFVAAFAALARYDRARPFRHWIARIAINASRDWARRRAVRKMFSFALPLDAAAEVVDESPTPEISLRDREELERTMAAIAMLRGNLKRTLVLRTIEGLSQAETAAVLGISEKAVETRLHRARTKLAGALRD